MQPNDFPLLGKISIQLTIWNSFTDLVSGSTHLEKKIKDGCDLSDWVVHWLFTTQDSH